MRYFYDTEFLEDGRTVDLISIGIVAEDGREYYAVSSDVTKGKLLRRIRGHEWLMANVVPALPRLHGDAGTTHPAWLFDHFSPLVKSRELIATEVREFLLFDGNPELWADYGAYDHVALCQLWGTMMDLPKGMPMFTRDIQQEAARGVAWDALPQQAEGQHNALADARHCMTRWQHLEGRA